MPKTMKPIFQDQLAEFAQVSAEYTKIASRRKKLRAALLGQYRRGAVTEPGPLKLDVTEREFRSLSHSSLTAIFGFQWLEELLAAIPAATQYVVKVVKAKPAKIKMVPVVDFSKTIHFHK
jgi:hypothetical protein